MSDCPVRVLLIEDDNEDYRLVRELFVELPEGAYRLDRVADYESALQAFEKCQHDAYLVDYSLGEHTGLDIIAEAVRRDCRAPLIMLAAQRDRELDLRATQAGAVDYLVKDQLSAIVLERSMRYALEQNRRQESIRGANVQLEQCLLARTAELAELSQTFQAEVAVRKRIEQELRESGYQKDAFLASLAHELRTPLAALMNATELMGLAPEMEQDPELTAMMARQLALLVQLVDDLLDVSRISQGTPQDRQLLVPLREAITADLVYVNGDVVLPLAQPATNQVLESSPPGIAASELPTLRVLIVDDNESAAHLISRLLAKLGQNVLIAHSAESALARFAQFQPDLVISDLGMPEISGLELAARIRASKHVKQPKLVALSGDGQASDREEALAAGFDLYRTKPLGLQTLERLLREISK